MSKKRSSSSRSPALPEGSTHDVYSRRRHRRRRSVLWSTRSGRTAGPAAAVLLLAACVSGLYPGTSVWQLRASTLQRFLSYDMPLDQVPMTATHNTFNSVSGGSIRWEGVPNQIYSVTDQISCLGVRGIELDAHFIEELVINGDEAGGVRVCHTRALQASKVVDVCNTLQWKPCEALGVYNFGDNTGCSESAQKLADVLREVSTWASQAENEREVLFIKMEIILDSNKVHLIEDILTEVLRKEIIFTPDDFEIWRATT